MTDAQKLEAIKAEIERRKNEPFLNASFNECKQFILNKLQEFIAQLDEQSEDCDTCTNDKGCVACENGELYEGKPTDYTKSNEEKAKDLTLQLFAINFIYFNSISQRKAIEKTLVMMAEWKDEQFKQDLDNAFKSADHVQYTNGYNDAVEKACEWLRNVTYFDYGARMFEYGTFIKDFKQAMYEGEE